METKLAYAATLTIESRNGETGSFETRYFATREQAVDYAKCNTNAVDNNGKFVGEWQDDWILASQLGGSSEGDWTIVRMTATVETVTLEEIEASL